jgi:hypothetical protein
MCRHLKRFTHFDRQAGRHGKLTGAAPDGSIDELRSWFVALPAPPHTLDIDACTSMTPRMHAPFTY